MKRYILVKDDGDTFVSWADCLEDAFDARQQPPGLPDERRIIAVVTDEWAKRRRGSWIERARQHPTL